MKEQKRGEIVIYKKKDGGADIHVTLKDENLWLSEQHIALLFERNRTVIGRHIKNIFATNDLARKSNVQKMHIANSDKPD